MAGKDKTLKVEQIGSPIGAGTQRETLIGLGLNKIGRSDLPDTPAKRGMIDKVKHLVKVVDGEADSQGEAR